MQTKKSLARFVRFRNSDELVQGSALAAKIDGRTSGHSKKICDPLRSLQVILSFNRHVGWANFDRFASAGPSASWRPNEPRHGSAEALFIAEGQRMDFIASTHCPRSLSMTASERGTRRRFERSWSYLSSPTASNLFNTQRATAAAALEKVVYILPSVIIGDLFSLLDTAQCYDYDTAIASHRLRVRLTGMINVASHIPPWRAVDGPSAVQCKHISCATCLTLVSFLDRYTPTAISRDIGGAFDRPRCEQAEAR